MSYGIRLLVSGDSACFTRPEMKVERDSCDLVRPSARGIIGSKRLDRSWRRSTCSANPLPIDPAQ
jgi:CRISPR-associated Cas5-like protein